MSKPTLGEAIEALIKLRLADVHTSIPGRIESYDAVKQEANILVLVKDRFPREDGGFDVQSVSVLPAVPIIFPGGGGYRATFPLAAGDTVAVFFTERSIDRWYELGGEQDPEDGRRHHVSDVYAVPGLHDSKTPWTGASASDATLGKDGGPQVVFKTAEIHFGTDAATPATEQLVLGTTYRAQEGAMLDSFTNALTLCVTALATAITALGTGIASNAIPVVGGALAAPSFSIVVAQLGIISTQLGQMLTALALFKAGSTTYLSNIVKGK